MKQMTCIAQSLADRNTIINWFALFGKKLKKICLNVWGYRIHPYCQPW